MEQNTRDPAGARHDDGHRGRENATRRSNNDRIAKKSSIDHGPIESHLDLASDIDVSEQYCLCALALHPNFGDTPENHSIKHRDCWHLI